MNGRDLVRSVKSFGPLRGMREARAARRSRGAGAQPPERGPERARVPGAACEARPLPGGGVVRFARSELRIVVAVGGAVFCGWDGAEPAPSYGLAGEPPEPDPRAGIEPDKDGGWRVVSERVTVEVSRHGGVEIRTPGGVVLRRDLPPRWWEPVAGGPARWSLRSEVPPDARVFGLGGRASGVRLRETAYRLWNGGTAGPGAVEGAPPISMPVQTVVADAGTHLVFHDTTWGGRVTVREGQEGAGSGHDRPGTIEMRMDGGPLRSWVVVGSPARVLSGYAQLTGAPALPPSWALGRHHAGGTAADERRVRELAEESRERSVPLSAVHLGGPSDGGEPFALDGGLFPALPALAKDLAEDDVRLVRVVDPAVGVRPEGAVYAGGAAAGVFLRDADGGELRSGGRSGGAGRVHPDFTDPRARAWWAEWYEDLVAQGFSGVWHEPEGRGLAAAGGLPPVTPRVLEGRGGDGREAHNVAGTAMARAAWDGLRGCRPAERPFVVSRSGWAGMQRYGGAWCDEVPEGWPGLRAALSLVLGLGLSGVPLAGARTATAPDGLGGADGEHSAELSLRGVQLGAYLPLLLTAGGPDAAGPYADAVAAALRERERLRPYLVSLAHLSRLTGAPMVRPLWWGCPEDRALRDCEDAFLLGDSLLVAPVLEPGAVRRSVRLPRGRWYDTATERVFEGPGTVTPDAPPERIPVLARAGAVFAVRGAGGAVELEVWAPAPGRKGGGLVVRDSGDGWAEPEIERYASGWDGGRVVVERWAGEDRVPVTKGLRVRGRPRGAA